MNYNALKNLFTRRLLMVAWTTTLVVGFMVSLPQLAHAQDTISPPIAPGLEVEAGNEPFLLGRGVGTQNYVCAPCDPTKRTVLWVLRLHCLRRRRPYSTTRESNLSRTLPVPTRLREAPFASAGRTRTTRVPSGPRPSRLSLSGLTQFPGSF